MSGIARHHSEWLSLIEVSGPFLTLPVLVRVFPQGLPKVDGKKLGRLRAAYEEWANAQDAKAPDAGALARLGIRPGDRVFALLGRTPELYVTALGALKHRAIFCPLFSAFGPEPISASPDDDKRCQGG